MIMMMTMMQSMDGLTKSRLQDLTTTAQTARTSYLSNYQRTGDDVRFSRVVSPVL